MAQRPIQFLVIGLLAGVLAACGGSGTPPDAPSPVPSTGPPRSTSTCPPGTDADVPGPAAQNRPAFANPDLMGQWVSAAFDWQSGRVVVVDSYADTWTFNVCTNTWERIATQGADSSLGPFSLFYDAVSDLTYAISAGAGFPTIRTFSVETATWTRVLQHGGLWRWEGDWPRGWPHYVMDPTKRVIYGYQSSTGQMRAYNIAANTWAEVDQNEPRPPTTAEGLPSFVPKPGQPPTDLDALMTFDQTVDRIVLSLGHHATDPEAASNGYPAWTVYSQTWTFDPGTGTWSRAASDPGLWFPCLMSGTETAFDQASRSNVVFAEGSVATFDATSATWTTAAEGTGWPPSTRLDIGSVGTPRGPLARHDHGLVDDVVNGRVLILGGTYRTGVDTWQVGTDVWAYTASTNTWSQLVPTAPAATSR